MGTLGASLDDDQRILFCGLTHTAGALSAVDFLGVNVFMRKANNFLRYGAIVFLPLGAALRGQAQDEKDVVYGEAGGEKLKVRCLSQG